MCVIYAAFWNYYKDTVPLYIQSYLYKKPEYAEKHFKQLLGISDAFQIYLEKYCQYIIYTRQMDENS